jgi:hypothetical protein
MSNRIVPKDFYVYLHRRATDGRVFYVGKGSGVRAWSKDKRSQHWISVVKKHGITVEIFIEGLQEWAAFEFESDLISMYGRQNLCNMTDGGEGISGMSHSDASKKLISIKNSGKAKTSQHRQKLSQALKGRKISEEVLSERFGRKFTDEHKAAISKAHKGRAKSAKARLNMGKSQRKPVLCVQTGSKFISVQDACNWIRQFNPKASTSPISMCCLGTAKTAYGYTWQHLANDATKA